MPVFFLTLLTYLQTKLRLTINEELDKLKTFLENTTSTNSVGPGGNHISTEHHGRSYGKL
jgi:hypothetical protein